MRKRLLLCLLMVSSVVGVYGQGKGVKFQQSLFNKHVKITNTTEINTDALEFSPTLYQNGLVYVTSRLKNGPVDESIGETYFELFYSELDPNGLPQKPQSFSPEINSQFHEGPAAFNRSGDRMFFSRNNMENGLTKSDVEGKIRMKIYEAKRGLFDWEEIEPLPFNDDGFSCMHPTLSSDEDRIYFASNMPGGYGGYDLYFAVKVADTWSEPINMGSEINTNKNEVFPFIHDSGVLFFTSNGHPGKGKLDLFMIDISTNNWGNVINLGKPFNSSEDDLGLILTPVGNRGYFASNRADGLGKDDIYMFEAPSGIQGVEMKEKVITTLVVNDESNNSAAFGAEVRLYERDEDGLVDNPDLYNIEMVPDSTGSGEMVLRLRRKKEEELGEPDLMTDRYGKASTELTAGRDFLILVTKPGYLTKEIVYTTKDKIGDQELRINISPKNCINLEGLSVSTNYGSRVPGALIRIVNNCTNETELVRSDLNGTFEYCLPMGCDFTVTGEKEGYHSGSSTISTEKIRGRRSVQAEIEMQPITESVLTQPIQEGTVIVLENIYYDFNKSSIRRGSTPDLDALVKLMQTYPSMEIEMTAHTDSRGSKDYNLQLSLKRAESAKQYLISHDIDPERIRAFGYGESQPRNHCIEGIECSESEHQYNRRTEVKITKIDEAIKVQYNPDGVEIIEKKN